MCFFPLVQRTQTNFHEGQSFDRRVAVGRKKNGVGTGEENNGQAVGQEAGPEDEVEKNGEEYGPGILPHVM